MFSGTISSEASVSSNLRTELISCVECTVQVSNQSKFALYMLKVQGVLDNAGRIGRCKRKKKVSLSARTIVPCHFLLQVSTTLSSGAKRDRL